MPRGAKVGHLVSLETRAKISAARLGFKMSDEQRAKISETLMGHKHSDETRAKMAAAAGVGERHALWRGDEAHVATKHQWLRDHFPKTGRCEQCDKEGRTDYSFKHHPKSHTRDPDDYRELCVRCHIEFDKWLHLGMNGWNK